MVKSEGTNKILFGLSGEKGGLGGRGRRIRGGRKKKKKKKGEREKKEEKEKGGNLRGKTKMLRKLQKQFFIKLFEIFWKRTRRGQDSNGREVCFSVGCWWCGGGGGGCEKFKVGEKKKGERIKRKKKKKKKTSIPQGNA